MSADPTLRPEMRRDPRREIPDATVARLPQYLRALTHLGAAGATSVSSEELAAEAGVRPTLLRKDLSLLGSYGIRGVGYDVEHLALEISTSLGSAHDWPVAIVGMGNLGRALAAYSGFASGGFHVAALFDEDPALIGEQVRGIAISPGGELSERIVSDGIMIGVIATPATGAQAVCDTMVAAGVRSILNFAPVVLVTPPGVTVRKVDLSTELHVLAFYRLVEQEEATVT